MFSKYYSAQTPIMGNSSNCSIEPSMRIFVEPPISDKFYASNFLERLKELHKEVGDIEFKLDERIAINNRLYKATNLWWEKYGPIGLAYGSGHTELRVTASIKVSL